MSETTTTIPRTLEERLPLGEAMAVEADWDTFLDLLEEGNYPVQYDEGQILSFMGYGTQEHEALVARIIYLLSVLLDNKPYQVYGSNLALQPPGTSKQYFNADCTLVQGQPQQVTLRGEMKAVTNPVMLVEVLSKSTHNFDLGQKFQRYKTIPSLQQILYVDSQAQRVISYRREEKKGVWLIEDLTEQGEKVPVLQEGEIEMQALYKHWKSRG
ncbi:MAG: hypothetical protein GVY26_01575 [Bacteroidetes bacterium]|jgi:Uma2 family endonuclease|nr:hypothetical protein [Bacteroidota bacterium]